MFTNANVIRTVERRMSSLSFPRKVDKDTVDCSGVFTGKQVNTLTKKDTENLRA